MIVTPQRFLSIGAALFGNTQWYAELGRHLGLDRSQIFRYARAQTNVPARVRLKLASLCRTRGAELLRLAEELDSQGEKRPAQRGAVAVLVREPCDRR